MNAHRIRQGDGSSYKPEGGRAAAFAHKESEEGKEGKNDACTVMVQLERVVTPIERGTLDMGLLHVSIRDTDKRAS